MIWNETIECMDREEMRKLQSLRLKRVVEHAYHNSPFYRKKMQEMGITPDDVQTIDDICLLYTSALRTVLCIGRWFLDLLGLLCRDGG